MIVNEEGNLIFNVCLYRGNLKLSSLSKSGYAKVYEVH